MTVEYKFKSPEEFPRILPDPKTVQRMKRQKFDWMLDGIAAGDITAIIDRKIVHEIDKRFERFVRENNIQSFEEIEAERRIEVIDGEDGSVTYQVIQEYRKKPTV